jgi:hypothetical protein
MLEEREEQVNTNDDFKYINYLKIFYLKYILSCLFLIKICLL